jgi:hypothetical protein
MSYYAKIENGIVVQVNIVEDDFFNNNPNRYTGFWVKTCYNTKGGIHYNPETNKPSTDQSKALRKNTAGVGYSYDEQRDAFIPPKPFNKWVLNEDTCRWESPVPYPDDEKQYVWNDNKSVWEELVTD